AEVHVGQQFFIPVAPPDCNQNVFCETVETGTHFRVKSVVSADGRFVALKFGLQISELTPEARRLAASDGPAVAQAAFSGAGQEWRSAPHGPLLVNVQQVETNVVVPDGGTVLLGGLKKVVETRTEMRVPVLCKLPGVGCLFKNVAYGRETVSTLVLV